MTLFRLHGNKTVTVSEPINSDMKVLCEENTVYNVEPQIYSNLVLILAFDFIGVAIFTFHLWYVFLWDGISRISQEFIPKHLCVFDP